MAKRLLALLLSILILGSLAACGPMAPAETPTDEPSVPPVTDPPTEPPTEPPTDAPTEPPVVEPTFPGVVFEDVKETIYTTDVLNVRTGPGTEYERIGQLNIGESVLRTGIGSNGWSRILYMGETAYVHSDYITTEAPEAPEVSFEDVEETVYTTNVLNVRSGPGTNCAWIGQLAVGEEVVRTGIGSNGWSRILYNGETAYVHGYYLSTASGIERLEGSWISVRRDGEILSALVYGFTAEGTGTLYGEAWYYSDGAEGESPWITSGVDGPYSFSYELLGDEVKIRFDAYEDDWGTFHDAHTRIYAVYQLDDTWLVMSDVNGSYVRDNDRSLEELCEILDVDDSAPQTTE